jgi:hypothetical protein
VFSAACGNSGVSLQPVQGRWILSREERWEYLKQVHEDLGMASDGVMLELMRCGGSSTLDNTSISLMLEFPSLVNE